MRVSEMHFHSMLPARCEGELFHGRLSKGDFVVAENYVTKLRESTIEEGRQVGKRGDPTKM